MCNHCSDHTHAHNHPEIVQLMPVQKDLYAVYDKTKDFSVKTGKGNISLVPILFMGLIRHGDKTMVEGFFASGSINSCEDIDGFKGYAASLEDAEKLYS
ncbi:MAG: hypothetical protein DRH34_05250 [Deltaproteobacteria bacterium]|nr:MAG: hypothetical protein DRH34_05250 [Deltaproteobacteria bacterium]RLC20039.1 MAG: hypothetical protein DRH93_14430 [Deltaproteobacteria bacterium]